MGERWVKAPPKQTARTKAERKAEGDRRVWGDSDWRFPEKLHSPNACRACGFEATGPKNLEYHRKKEHGAGSSPMLRTGGAPAQETRAPAPQEARSERRSERSAPPSDNGARSVRSPAGSQRSDRPGSHASGRGGVSTPGSERSAFKNEMDERIWGASAGGFHYGSSPMKRPKAQKEKQATGARVCSNCKRTATDEYCACGAYVPGGRPQSRTEIPSTPHNPRLYTINAAKQLFPIDGDVLRYENGEVIGGAEQKRDATLEKKRKEKQTYTQRDTGLADAHRQRIFGVDSPPAPGFKGRKPKALQSHEATGYGVGFG